MIGYTRLRIQNLGVKAAPMVTLAWPAPDRAPQGRFQTFGIIPHGLPGMIGYTMLRIQIFGVKAVPMATPLWPAPDRVAQGRFQTFDIIPHGIAGYDRVHHAAAATAAAAAATATVTATTTAATTIRTNAESSNLCAQSARKHGLL